MHHAYLDKFAAGDSFFHRLDARVKFLCAVGFTIAALAVGNRQPGRLWLYAPGPFAVLVFAGVPLWFVTRRILMVSPFVLVLAISCLLYDRTAADVAAGPYVLHLTGGTVRCLAIIGKFVITMMTLFALVCTTRFSDLLAALERLKVPQTLIMQLGLLYRFLFIIVDRVHHMLRARNARRGGGCGLGQEIRTGSAMVGALFIRSIETAQNVQTAMQARGFCGKFHSIRPARPGRADLMFAICAILYIVLAQVAAHLFSTGRAV